MSVPSPTSNHLLLFELLCLTRSSWVCCSGLAPSKEGGKGDLGVLFMCYSLLHRAQTQFRDLGQKFRDAESIHGENDGVQLQLKVTTSPAPCIVFSVSFISQPASEIVHARNWFLVHN